jgi:hypothetical protein
VKSNGHADPRGMLFHPNLLNIIDGAWRKTFSSNGKKPDPFLQSRMISVD